MKRPFLAEYIALLDPGVDEILGLNDAIGKRLLWKKLRLMVIGKEADLMNIAYALAWCYIPFE